MHALYSCSMLMDWPGMTDVYKITKIDISVLIVKVATIKSDPQCIYK